MSRRVMDEVIVKVSETPGSKPGVLEKGELAANVSGTDAAIWVGTGDGSKRVGGGGGELPSTSDASGVYEGGLLKIRDLEYTPEQPEQTGENYFTFNVDGSTYIGDGSFTDGNIDITTQYNITHVIGGANAAVEAGGGSYGIDVTLSGTDADGNDVSSRIEALDSQVGVLVSFIHNGNEYKFINNDYYVTYSYTNEYTITAFEHDDNLGLPELDLNPLDGTRAEVKIFPVTVTPAEDESLAFIPNTSTASALIKGRFKTLLGTSEDSNGDIVIEGTRPDWIVANNGNKFDILPSSVGQSSISIGYGSESAGDASIAIGSYTQATAQDAIAIGDNSKATLSQTIGIGSRAESRAVGAISIGSEVSSQYADTIAIGNNVALSFADSMQITTRGIGGVLPLGGEIIISTNQGAFKIDASGVIHSSDDGGSTWTQTVQQSQLDALEARIEALENP